MPAPRSRTWLRAAIAATAAGTLTAVVLSAVAKIQDASDRAH